MAVPAFTVAGVPSFDSSACAQASLGAAVPAAFGSLTPSAGTNPPLGNEIPQGQLLSGTCKAWLEHKGFGFVTTNAGGPDVFVHRNQLSDGQSLTQGAVVTFECRFNPARAKYEATTCSGATAGVPGALAGGKGGGSQDNLFVAGLPMDVTEERVREIFGQYGSVTQCKVLPDQPGRNDRAAVVRFADETQAKWMVDNMNGNIPVGMASPLTVRFAGDRSGGGKGGVGFGKAMPPPLADNRFNPYGSLTGLGATAPAAALPCAGSSGTQLSEASLAAALAQLLPTLQHMQTAGGQTPGAAGIPGVDAAADPSAMLALASMSTQPGVGALGGLPGSSDLAGSTAPSGSDPAQAAASVSPGAAAAVDASGGMWMEAKDPSSGRVYYYHSITRETKWDKPAEMG